ncbi:hypothetical protein KUTeg_024107 [Tegillarca granosa]|uniref:Delta-like protein n=1 Tax=Tegillarca granosa TaxID=220873 RepID=A0ABQ9DWE2_TEGGR|nr:hypothetical protein KUTeg_024107 [Tegillarca granosa]
MQLLKIMEMYLPGLTLLLSLVAQVYLKYRFWLCIIPAVIKKTRSAVLGTLEYAPCSADCRTFFTICLLHYTASLTDNQYCTFGKKVTPVLGGNTINETALSVLNYFPLKIDFSFSWPTSFSLIIEVWHDAFQNTSTSDTSQRILKAAFKDSMEPTSEWKIDKKLIDQSEIRFKYRIICDESYYGPSCDKVCRSRDDRFGHYICDENGTKVCLSGWEGEFCTKAKCSPGCNLEHGYCEKPYECRCYNGWSEADKCNKCLLDPNCLNGHCHIPYQCICNDGWQGKYCNIDTNYCSKYKPCLNNGTCISDDNKNFTCSCQPGYTGETCNMQLCFPRYCRNNGECQNTTSNPICNCKEGYYGDRCQYKISTCDEIVCSHNGSCYIGNYGAMCACTSGYSGIFCEKEIDECQSNPCKNGGTCLDGIQSYFCKCQDGYIGRNCDIVLNPCMGIRCYHGGTCVVSNSGFSQSCSCKAGFTGYRCEIPLDPCNDKVCQNGGTCKYISSGTDLTCECPEGYKGYFCEEKIIKTTRSTLDPCSSRPCLHGGICESHLNTFSCSCDSQYVGSFCEVLRIQSDQAVTQSNGKIPISNTVNSCVTYNRTCVLYFSFILSYLFVKLLSR